MPVHVRSASWNFWHNIILRNVIFRATEVAEGTVLALKPNSFRKHPQDSETTKWCVLPMISCCRTSTGPLLYGTEASSMKDFVGKGWMVDLESGWYATSLDVLWSWIWWKRSLDVLQTESLPVPILIDILCLYRQKVRLSCLDTGVFGGNYWLVWTWWCEGTSSFGYVLCLFSILQSLIIVNLCIIVSATRRATRSAAAAVTAPSTSSTRVRWITWLEDSGILTIALQPAHSADILPPRSAHMSGARRQSAGRPPALVACGTSRTYPAVSRMVSGTSYEPLRPSSLVRSQTYSHRENTVAVKRKAKTIAEA